MIDVEQRLLDLGAALEFPPTPDLAAAVRTRLASTEPAVHGLRLRAGAWRSAVWSWLAAPRWQRRVAAVGLALVLALAVVLGIEPVRTTVAHWLGIRGVQVVPVQTLPPVPTRTPPPTNAPPGASLNLGSAVTLDEARARAGFTVVVPSQLGAPDAVWLNPTRGDSSLVVSLVYGPRPGLPQSGQSGVGLLVTEVRSSIDTQVFNKFIGPDTTLLPATVRGAGPAYWLNGFHGIAYVDPKVGITFDTLRLAGPTLFFERGDITVRVEASVDEQTAVGIAESLR